MTDQSSERLLSCDVLRDGHGPVGIQHVLHQWSDQFNAGQPFPQSSCCMQMPAPHSMLLASGQWKRYAVPYLLSGARSRGLGLRRVPA
eukprot:9326982-Alexandrium_andersonii.AAC.1